MICKTKAMNKITIFAMTKKGYEVVTSIYAKYSNIIDCVVSAEDPALSEDYYYEIKNFCRKNSIHFFDHKNFESIKTDFAFGVSWRWLINTDSQLIVFHDSLLPRYRGFNPLVSALINGDTEIGVTALYAADEYDKGDIINNSIHYIEYPITIREAIDIILKGYSSLALEIAGYISRGETLPRKPQTEKNASYSLWRDEDDYYIDWSADATVIKRFIDAVGFPYRGAASMLDGFIVRLLKVSILDDVKIENRTPGKIIFIKNSKPVIDMWQRIDKN